MSREGGRHLRGTLLQVTLCATALVITSQVTPKLAFPAAWTSPRWLLHPPHEPCMLRVCTSALQVTLCATASLVTPRGVLPGRLDVSASQLHFVGNPPEAPVPPAAGRSTAPPPRVRPGRFTAVKQIGCLVMHLAQ